MERLRIRAAGVRLALGGQAPVVAAAQLDHFAALDLDRFELGDREDDVAVAAGADLALDVLDPLDDRLGLLGAAGTDDGQLQHASMVASGPDGRVDLHEVLRQREADLSREAIIPQKSPIAENRTA